MSDYKDELVEYVDEAGKAFAADVEPMQADYLENMRQLAAARDAAFAEAGRIRREAETAYNAGRAEEVSKYTGRVRAAARKRSEESEHPEQITQACNGFLRPTENSGATLKPSDLLKMIGRSEKWRREGEEALARKRRRMNIVHGIG